MPTRAHSSGCRAGDGQVLELRCRSDGPANRLPTISSAARHSHRGAARRAYAQEYTAGLGPCGLMSGYSCTISRGACFDNLRCSRVLEGRSYNTYKDPHEVRTDQGRSQRANSSPPENARLYTTWLSRALAPGSIGRYQGLFRASQEVARGEQRRTNLDLRSAGQAVEISLARVMINSKEPTCDN